MAKKTTSEIRFGEYNKLRAETAASKRGAAPSPNFARNDLPEAKPGETPF